MANTAIKVYEDEEQEAIFRWASYIPELETMYAVPNGQYRPKNIAVKLKRQGVKSGVSDICLPLPKGKYHGLYLELKVGKNKPTENQKEFLKKVISVGYCGVVCYGFEDAADVITSYLRCEDLDARCRKYIY